jgi:signal transduction histidine kinase
MKPEKKPMTLMNRRNGGWMFSFILLILLLAGCSSEAGEMGGDKPAAVRGAIDLTDWELGQDGTVFLDGEWEFHWMKLLAPEDFVADRSLAGAEFINVPDFWHKQESAGKGKGFATYRLNVHLNRADAGQQLALYIPYGVESAYKLWINGEPLAAAGKPGTSKSSMEGKYLPQVVHFSGQASNEIVIQVSNYVQRTAGIWDEVRLGEAGQVTSFWNQRMASELFVAGGIVMMGLYHLGLYFLRRKDPAPLYFGAFCLLLGIRSLFLGEVYINHLFPGLGFEMYKKLEYLGQYLGPALFILYVQALFPKDINKKMVKVLVVFDVLLSSIVVFTPAVLFTYTLPASHVSLVIYAPYVIYVFIVAARRKREGALFCCVLFIIMALTILNDVLYYNNIIVTFDMAKFGLFIFIFAQAFLLSIKFSKAFRSVEQLSQKQAMWSQELENTVKDRTRELTTTLTDLQNTQKQLVESEKMAALGALVAGIAHEINTPVGISVTAASHLQEKTDQLKNSFQSSKMKKSELGGFLDLVDESAQIVSVNLARAAELVRGFKQVAVDQSSELLRSFRIKEYLGEVLVSLGPQLRKTCLKVTITGPDDLTLYSYPGAVSQIVTNLVMNSIIHAFEPDEEGAVQIEAVREGAGIMLTYSDNGKGMTPEVRERVFDPFFTTNRAGGGTGLGMHIIFNLVTQSLNGTITCDSEPGKGSAFRIYIPSREIPEYE